MAEHIRKLQREQDMAVRKQEEDREREDQRLTAQLQALIAISSPEQKLKAKLGASSKVRCVTVYAVVGFRGW